MSEIAHFIARGRKRRLYSVPEAPDLPDSEAFIRDVERFSWSHHELRLNDVTAEGGGRGREVIAHLGLLPRSPRHQVCCCHGNLRRIWCGRGRTNVRGSLVTWDRWRWERERRGWEEVRKEGKLR